MRIVLDLHSDSARIAGTVSAAAHKNGYAFDGWLELMQILEEILAERPKRSPEAPYSNRQLTLPQGD
jgi:hypothetical protein